ncbi:hypothetical protein, partial [Sinorhizobium terangae]|uniref:hypothetical protein n=1 Tax=Sinorhizobium terangae TaxID=110322 RepID=UPI001AED6CED
DIVSLCAEFDLFIQIEDHHPLAVRNDMCLGTRARQRAPWQRAVFVLPTNGRSVAQESHQSGEAEPLHPVSLFAVFSHFWNTFPI